MNDSLKEQSNPFSTGGGGVNFETRVQALFAMALLAGVSIPGLPLTAKARELKFQAKYDGVHTDDFVLVADDKTGGDYRLFAQIKHAITISAQDSLFSEVIKSAWSDFKKAGVDGRIGAIALITGPLPKKDINGVLPILEWARYSATSKEFIKKSTTEGFTSKEKLEKLNAFKNQLKTANENQDLTDEELWQFLKIFHLLSFDLDSKASIVGCMMGALIRYHSDEAPHLVVARLITCVQEFNQNAGTLTSSSAPQDLLELFQQSISSELNGDIGKLRERGDHIFDGISTAIGGIHVQRDEDVAKLENAFEISEFVFVTGERGVGKSGVVKDFISARRNDIAVFYLRAEDLDKSHLNDVFTSIGMRSSLGQIAEHLSMIENKVLVIESAEKILELNYQSAFTDLLKFIKRQGGWKIIATGRDYAYQKISFGYLQLCQVSFSTVNIEGFSELQLEKLCSEAAVLKPLVENNSLAAIIKIPFFIELGMRALSNGAIFGVADTETEFRSTIWNSVIANDAYRKGGLPGRRRTTFIEIAKKRAKAMLFGVHEKDFDVEAVAALEADHLIYRDNRAYIGPSHDVLEDWALEEFVDEEYFSSADDPKLFLAAIGSEPAINRGFRLWLQRKLNTDAELKDFVEQVLIDSSIENYWKDETITAILQSDRADAFLSTLKAMLLKNNNELLLRFTFILRIACQRPWAGLGLKFTKGADDQFNALILQPYGHGWAALINFIYETRDELVESSLPSVVEIINAWGGKLNLQADLPEEARVVGLLGLYLLEPVKDAYKQDQFRRKILSVILKVYPLIQVEFNDLVERDVFVSKCNRRRLAYVDELCQLILRGDSVIPLYKESPDFVIRLAWHEWFKEHEVDTFSWGRKSDVEASFGLDAKRDYSSASGIKGPFRYLFLFHARKTLDFVIELLNRASDAFAESELASDFDDASPFKSLNETVASRVVIKLNDGSIIDQLASLQLWNGYRGFSNLPGVLQCALMALESWLADYVERSGPKNEISWIFNHILKSSNSVMPTAVLASVATAFPDKVGTAALPLLRCGELYALDIRRQSQEGTRGGWFGGAFSSDPLLELYTQERKKANSQPCRKHSLENLLLTFQFDEGLRKEALSIIDDLQEQALVTKSENLRFMIHRTDSRNFSLVKNPATNEVYLKTDAELPHDLKKVKESFDKQQKIDSRIQSLYLWTRKAWEDNEFDSSRYASHIDALAEARNLALTLQEEAVVTEFGQMAVGAIRTSAALCVRDEFENLGDEDLNWVISVILEAVLEHVDDVHSLAASDATDSYGTVACAFALPRFFELDLTQEDVDTLKFDIACALTHANNYVRMAAAKGIREYLWQVDSSFAAFCMRAVIAYGRFEEEVLQTKRNRRYQSQQNFQPEESCEDTQRFRTDFSEGKIYAEVDLEVIEERSLELIHLPVLMIPLGTKDPDCTQLIKTVVEYVYSHQYRDDREKGSDRLNEDIVNAIQKCLVEHVINSRHSNFEDVRELLIRGCSEAPSFTYLVKLSFDVAMEKLSEFDAIWALWKVLEPGLETIAKEDVSPRFSGKETDRNRFLRGMLYMDFRDNGHPSNMVCLKKGVDHLLEFSRKNGENSHVFEALCSLIYRYPKMFFADGIGIATEKYKENSRIIRMQINTAYYLEISLARYLQVDIRGPLPRKMYQACLSILTGIVETGSARAYYLRDNLVSARRIAI